MDTALALGILFGVFSLDIGATECVIRSNGYTTPQKALQIAVVWVVPLSVLWWLWFWPKHAATRPRPT